jgi:glycosyltransferase involved in cell wall biosynthesis
VTTAPELSIVLPAYRDARQVREVVPQMAAEIQKLGTSFEIIIVVNGPRDGTDEAADEVHRADPRVRVLRADDAGWGRAVRTGLQAANGELLAYTNLARTPPHVLRTALALALDCRGYVVKAHRRVRDSALRRGGSLIYNLECRTLFDLSVFDVNGTPKVFPAEFTDLRDIRRDDDLIDVEFLAICTAREYQIVEFSVPALPRYSGTSTTKLRSAWRMYTGALALRRELAARAITKSPQTTD